MYFGRDADADGADGTDGTDADADAADAADVDVDVEADLSHLWPVTCSNKSGNASGSNGCLARLARLEIKFSKLKEVSML